MLDNYIEKSGRDTIDLADIIMEKWDTMYKPPRERV